MPFPTYKDSGANVRSVETVSSAAAGSNADPDKNKAYVTGLDAADDALAGSPVPAGGRASNATPTAVSADGDVVNGWMDRYGRRMVAQPADLITVTLTLDTNIYASGDLLADTQAVTAALRVSGGVAELVSLTVVDEDDQGVAFDVYVTSSTATAGTENAAPSISDANARSIQAIVPVATGDYKDLGGVKVACIKNIGAVCKGSGSVDLNVFVVNGAGTPTFTASGVRLVLGFRQY